MIGQRLSRGLALRCAVLVALFSSPAFAGGPPWISIEMPGDPTNRSSRGAVMLVHAYVCGGPTSAPVTGTAEGIVKGQRQTIPLTLKPTGATGVYAVEKQWPSEGAWVLTFNMSIGPRVGTIVTLGTNGGVEPAEYHGQPSAVVRAASVQVLARNTTSEDVETLLRAAANGEHRTLASTTSAPAVGYLAGGLGAVAALLGAAVAIAFGRRRQTGGRYPFASTAL